MKTTVLAAVGTFILLSAQLAQAQAVVKSSDGVPIAYERHGRGPALIFVHGWSCDRSYWSAQVKPFAERYTVVTLDLAGHGASGNGRTDYTMESFGEDVAAVVNALALDRVILIGHSMGGDVIAEAARRLPGRVAGLIWVDTYKQLGSGGSPEQIEAFIAKMRPDFSGATKSFVRTMFVPGSDPALVERIAADMSSAPPAVALSALFHAFSYGRIMPRTLSQLKLPTIAINPDNPPSDRDGMKKHGVEVVVMPGVGHFLHMEKPEPFNALLMAAVGKLTR